MRTIIIDDEPLALELLADNIRNVDGLELVGEFTNASTAAQFLTAEKVDLIFCDIQMPGINGIQLVKSLTRKPLVVFVTAYQEFAIDGFELDVIDYLLKPVATERFLKACNKALQLHHLQKQSAPPIATPDGDRKHLFVYADYNLIKIRHQDIIYIEGVKDYVKLHVQNLPKPVLTRITFKALEEQLPAHEFFRVHKSYLVNVEHVQSVRRGMIKLTADTVPYSDNYRENVDRMTGKSDAI
ncbi:response regulator transcription factor [Mucilaginibacter sp. RS28]|uniref:Response regulator transcription factor n=1 Tax=Mucilaginibacter straminoryzae TaxID=2932774 RepID=A0A9X1X1U4_9SPHI|nr:response regulator transcription factor [Mucilaginibacter straminoryzae]MCJ8209604.1 response regulator transcription factor [Mucilaginibacter straminoryzae]